MLYQRRPSAMDGLKLAVTDCAENRIISRAKFRCILRSEQNIRLESMLFVLLYNRSAWLRL